MNPKNKKWKQFKKEKRKKKEVSLCNVDVRLFFERQFWKITMCELKIWDWEQEKIKLNLFDY